MSVCKTIFSVLKVEEKFDGTPKRVARVLLVRRTAAHFQLLATCHPPTKSSLNQSSFPERHPLIPLVEHN